MIKQEDFDTYLGAMNEIKERIAIIRRFFPNPPLEIDEYFAVEIIYLQFRLICELIAHACAVAHRDYAAISSDLRDAYKPADLMDYLARLNPTYFPIAVREVLIDRSLRLEPRGDAVLTAAELRALWGRSGDFLHVGRIKSIEKEVVTDAAYLHESSEKIMKLLDHHTITMPPGDVVIYVSMGGGPNGKPIAWRWDKAGSPSA